MKRRKVTDPIEHARIAGKARLRSMTMEDRRRVAALGAAARWRRVSKAQRSDAMRAVVQARWAQAKAAKEPAR